MKTTIMMIGIAALSAAVGFGCSRCCAEDAADKTAATPDKSSGCGMAVVEVVETEEVFTCPGCGTTINMTKAKAACKSMKDGKKADMNACGKKADAKDGAKAAPVKACPAAPTAQPATGNSAQPATGSNSACPIMSGSGM